MFTGIIRQTCQVQKLERSADFLRFAVGFPEALCEELETGASVAIDGCCQTVTLIEEATDGPLKRVWFDAMQETLRLTTLGAMQVGQAVNIERAARFGQEIGGHELSGHIDAAGTITAVERTSTNHIITLALPRSIISYVFNKGYLGVHGASLTVSDFDKSNADFKVYLIPETLKLTNLGALDVGDIVNLEIDRRTQVIVDTVQAYLDAHKPTA